MTQKKEQKKEASSKTIGTKDGKNLLDIKQHWIIILDIETIMRKI